MTAYVVRRLLQTALLLFLASLVFFLLLHSAPISPCNPGFMGRACEESLHLDQPIANQYLIWMAGLLHGDFGTSVNGQSVSTIILEKLPPTVLLVAVSFGMQQLIALPLGMLAALRQYSWFDGALTFLSYVALSMPAFLLGLFLIYLVGVHWTLLPVGHINDPSVPLFWSSDWFGALLHDPGYVLGDQARHLLLPAFVLCVTGIAVDSRFMRSAMLQVIHEDYIRTARAKGVRRRAIIFKHAFRNALLPIITNIGLYLPTLVGGTIVVEQVFTWGGLGYTFAQATGTQGAVLNQGTVMSLSSPPDFPTLLAILILWTVAVILANLLADLAYAWLDPRIRFEGGMEG